MSDTAAVRRQLQIKSGATNRLKKEHELYQKELVDQKIKTDRLVADGADEWAIKNSGKMTDESEKMIKDSAARLGKAYGELKDLVVREEAIPAGCVMRAQGMLILPPAGVGEEESGPRAGRRIPEGRGDPGGDRRTSACTNLFLPATASPCPCSCLKKGWWFHFALAAPP